MNQILDNNCKIRKYKFINFLGPDFNNNGYCDARYRMSEHSIDLAGTDVPTKVEVLNTGGGWQQHPVVFIHYGSYEARKNCGGSLIIFLPKGRYTSRPYDPFFDGGLYKQAEEFGLTKGSQIDVKSIAKEE